MCRTESYSFARPLLYTGCLLVRRAPHETALFIQSFQSPKGSIGGFVAPDLTASGKALDPSGSNEVVVSEGSVNYHGVGGMEQHNAQGITPAVAILSFAWCFSVHLRLVNRLSMFMSRLGFVAYYHAYIQTRPRMRLAAS